MAIKNVLIFSTSGFPIFTHRFKGDVIGEGHSETLMQGLISAIKSFANSFNGEEIESINMTKTKMVILPSMINKIIFVLICDYADDLAGCFRILEDIRDEVLTYHLEKLQGNNLSCISNKTKFDISKIIEKVIDTK